MHCNNAFKVFLANEKTTFWKYAVLKWQWWKAENRTEHRNSLKRKKTKSILVHSVLSLNTVETNKTGAFGPFLWENRLMIAAAAGAGRVSPSSNPSAHPSPHPQRWPRWRRVTASSARPLPHQTPRAKPPASSPRSTSLYSVYVTSLLKKTSYGLNRITLPSKDTSLW